MAPRSTQGKEMAVDRFDSDARLIFIHADMDAFFAAVEILDDPSSPDCR